MDKPTAEQFRGMLSEALEDPRKPEIQLEFLNYVFEQAAALIPKAVDDGLAQINEQVSGLKRDPFFEKYAQENPKFVEVWNGDVFNAVARRDPAERNKDFIIGLTRGTIDPLLRLRVSVNPLFAEFSDIKVVDEPCLLELPGYIKLCEAARDKNVGIAVVGLKGDGGAQQPYIIIDLSKTYEEGEGVNGAFRYPVLPEPEEEPPRTEQQARQPAREKKMTRYTIK